ncbi:MAG: hypothetical protein JW783_01835 [Bacteroidales bacterium]|nr:hypothetical protein [Bacteroidales bacterium]MBN2750199.1 hypothetical protein [Bacteroidales bacterium]MDX9854398.1 hypothetical protein [Tenuifilaceae bacterium]HPX05258.1 hypothetical protein [Tenuifilaceae bacterium]HQB79053.1 hypothetical protein [Tenuifilaceae bacterium]
MKIIYCTCNVSVIESLLQTLDSCNVRDYQIVEQVTVKNKKGDHRFNNPVWPGFNSAVIMQISDDDKAKSVMAAVKDMNRTAFNDNELVTACMWTMDDYFFD